VNFLTSWVDFAGARDETPSNFHEAVGMSMLSFFTGQKIIVETSNAEPLTTRINSVLIGTSGVGKRVAMLDCGHQLLVKVAGEIPSKEAFSVEDDVFVGGSNSALLRFIINRCGDGKKGLILGEEISGILGHGGSYTGGVVTTLAQGLDDSPFAKVDFHAWGEKKDDGKQGWESRCELPFAVGIFGSTDVWLRDAMDGRAAVGGLPGRMCWHVGHMKEEAQPFGKKRTEEEWREVVKEFVACVNRPKQVIVVDEFEGRLREIYDSWYRKHHKRRREEWINPRMEPWISRLNIWVLRVSVNFMVARGHATLQVEDMEDAISYLDKLEGPMEDVMLSLTADENHATYRGAIIKVMAVNKEKTGEDIMTKAKVMMLTENVFGNNVGEFELAFKSLAEKKVVMYQKAGHGYVLMKGGE